MRSFPTVVTITCGLLGIQASAQSQQSKHDPSHTAGTYSVSQTGRPLAEILLQLQQAFLYPIDYEEVAYESPSVLNSKTIMTIYGARKVAYTPQTLFSNPHARRFYALPGAPFSSCAI